MRGHGWLAAVVIAAMSAGAGGCNAILGINDPVHAEETDAQSPPDASSEEAPDSPVPDDVARPDSDQPDNLVHDGQPDQAVPDGSVDASEPDGAAPLTATEIGAGDNHSCAVLSDGSVRCWGLGFHGALGNGDSLHQKVPVQVIKSGGQPLTGALRVLGGRETTCALITGGTLTCWGLASSGQYGNGTIVSYQTADNSPTLSGITDYSVGFEHVCAASSGSAFCWGANSYRQVGPVTGQYVKPNQVANLANVTAVVAAYDHSCAVHGGAVSCWGNNTTGKLGNNTDANSDHPVSVVACGSPASPVQGVKAIAAGARHSCALRADQTLWCWGDGSDGTLGTGKLAPSFCAVKVQTNAPFDRIASGTNHMCAIATNGDLYCWGYNSNGQIGDGSSVDVHLPNKILDNVVSVEAGDRHTCAVKNDGTVWCWGWNDYFQLGMGDDVERHKPAQLTF